jgi:N-methylhydantoinase B
LAVLSKRLESIARRMAHTPTAPAARASSTRARDLSCCIVQQTTSSSPKRRACPSHVLVGPNLMSRWMIECHPRLSRGDAFLHNSPYHGNSHAADHTILVPVLDDAGVHRFTVFARRIRPTSAIRSRPPTPAPRETCTKKAPSSSRRSACSATIADVDDIVRMCRLRIRVPDQWWGDYQALIGAARVGERELLALGAEVGWDTLDRHAASGSTIRATSWTAAHRAGCRRPPHARQHHDPFPGHAGRGCTDQGHRRRRQRGRPIEVDLRDNPDCLPNGMNVTQANASSAVMIGIFSSLGEVVPRNAGSYRRIAIHLRENCCVGIPRHPGVLLALDHQSRSKVGNATQTAIAELRRRFRPRRIRHHRAGLDGGHLRPQPARRQPPVHQFALPDAYRRSGAPRADAWLTTVHIGDLGLCYLDSVELDELRYPIRVHAPRHRADSEGAGRFRGAPAASANTDRYDTTIEPGSPATARSMPRSACAAASPAAAPASSSAGRDGRLDCRRPVRRRRPAPGETIVSICCGGGGYGRPKPAIPSGSARIWPKAGSPQRAPSPVWAEGFDLVSRDLLDL